MKERKLRIAEFIETLETDRLSSSVLLGGATKPTDGIQTTTNGSCTNATKASCNSSTNNTDCDNATGLCNNSKNHGRCNNAFDPSIQDKPVTNPAGTTCR